MDPQQGHVDVVQRGRERGIRIINEGRENARLQSIKLTKILEEKEKERKEREKKRKEREEIERKVNSHNKEAEYICKWLLRARKLSIFRRTVTNSWTKICNRKIAGLKIMIFLRSCVINRINRLVKKNMKETERWINGLNRWLLKNGSSTEEMRWKSHRTAAANDSVVVVRPGVDDEGEA